ncbi:aminomethyl-transferring glycine dehydrogenase [Saccharomonospora xinjiangensis]|uniref:aminomethyl-transferring glycine dehydrogenase n=1 Tax=Saccharomonospora xinjiangensis TaxID=75294 RepID=UPI00106F1BE9|nr:aminomethyl-transferring glycine dehydrogenase [Saccharomonospora xinjiangensis]QBQ59802.1 Glycine dehydrogenase (decarboxylating) [Saccharomonospora xinjiangensis]
MSVSSSAPPPPVPAAQAPPAFVSRHVGPGPSDQAKMLAECGFGSVDALVAAAVPSAIRTSDELRLPEPASEEQAIAELRELARRNRPMTQMIGLGYHDTVTPAVIRRNVLENPAWYTAYTPYQPEISQGRLEALLNFQTVVSDLTGLATANASLLDEGTAVAEAVMLMKRAAKSRSNTVVVDAECLPQTVAVVRTRAQAVGVEVEVRDLSLGLPEEFFGVVVQYPGVSGVLRDPGFYEGIAEAAHRAKALYCVAADLLALTLLTAPGEFGADLAAGTTQRFGVPLGYGGPHAGYLAVRSGLERSLPGRLVGVSIDAAGAPAYRLALQTREQHIRREKATSNICTAQVLLAVMASMYAVYHGPDGLRRIAERVHGHAVALADALRAGGVEIVHDHFFDTVLARVPGRAEAVLASAREAGVNLGRVDADHVRVACDEVTTPEVLAVVLGAFGVEGAPAFAARSALPSGLERTGEYLTHEVFHTYRSETAMLRYLRRLADSDYALDRGMIPLGSCTMKLNATTEMEPVTWPEFANIHPFAPSEDAGGYHELVAQLSAWLAEVTGYDSVSLQPNAGSQGELAGLLAIRAYHRANGQPERDVCLIPSSAHGTNAASAVLAGMRVVVVACTADGDVDLDDLRAKADAHRDTLAAIMVTYPSTHGVYEAGIGELAEIVHEAGGQVYVDGANLNALLGLAKPGEFGGDVSHLNLHKTFCIPHGGGGPGVGPVAVRAHLAPYLPNHPLSAEAGPETGIGPISAAPFGSASILPISWAYVRMMGAEGLTEATKIAVLNANYVAARLAPHYPVLYTGQNGLVAHECILDLRGITKQTGVTVDDVAKRLIDYGFHAPTMSFPVPGTLMVEPTESEDLAELDRFCEAMIAIRHEIDEVANGTWPVEESPLRGAPHTAEQLAGDWTLPYDRRTAVYPGRTSPKGKYWSPVRRIEGAYGDRNLVCSCPPVSSYESAGSPS